MPRPNPRASAIQAALQGFSGTFFPLAQRQIAEQQEMSMRTALAKQELADAIQLAQEKDRLEREQTESQMRQALELGFEPEQLGPSGFTLKRKEPSLSRESLAQLHGVKPEEIPEDVLKLPESAQRQQLEAGRRSKGQVSSQQARQEMQEIRQANLELQQEAQKQRAAKDVAGLQKSLGKLRLQRTALSGPLLSLQQFAIENVGVLGPQSGLAVDYSLAKDLDAQIAELEQTISGIQREKPTVKETGPKTPTAESLRQRLLKK